MSNPNLYASSQSYAPGSNPNPAGINPAMLAAGFQNGPVGPQQPQQQQQQQPKFAPNAFGVSPAQLMGAGGGGIHMGTMNINAMNPNAMNTNPNPTQLLQQQQQHGMMNGSVGGMGGGGMSMMAMNPAAVNMSGMSSMNASGINPAALSQPGHPGFNPMAQSQQHSSLHQQPQAHMQPQQHQQPQQPPQHQHQQHHQQAPPLNLQQQMMLNALGMTREQFSSLSQAEKQQAWMKLFSQMQQLPGGNANSNPNPTPGGSQQMMPPPAPPQAQGGPISVPGRPPTSQGHNPGQPGLQQRPPTAQGHHRPPTAQGQQRPPTAQGMHIHRPPTAQGMQRPPTAQGHRPGPGPGSTPQAPSPAATNLAMEMGQMQPRPPTAQDQRQGPGGRQTRPPTAQGMPQTPTIATTHIAPGSRPPTAQSSVGQQISRPGTALSHRSPVSAGSAHSPGARPPSRAGEQAFGMNGYPKPPSQQQQMPPQGQPNPYPSTPQQQHQQQPSFAQKPQQGPQGQFGFQHMNPPTAAAAAMMQQQNQHPQGSLPGQQTPQQQQQQMTQGGSPAFGFPGSAGGGQQGGMNMQGSPPPMSMPGSPYRGAKRKIDSPHMSGGATPAIGPMGPPSMMPNRMSMSGPSGSGDLGAGMGMNGLPGGGGQAGGHQHGPTSQSPRPPNSNEMMGMNMSMGFTPGATGAGGGPQTPVRQGNMMGGGTPGLGAGQVGMGGTPMGQALVQQQQQHQHQQHQHQQLQHQQLQHQQLQHQQLQQQQQGVRQASLPRGASPLQQKEGVTMGGPGPMGMGMQVRASVPPAVPGPNVTGPVVRTPSTVAGTPVPGSSASSVTGVPSTAVSGGNALPASGGTGAGGGGASTSSSGVANSNSGASASVPGQLPPLPANVQLNPATTQITPVPLIDSLKHIPDIGEEEIVEIQGWMKRDKEYEGVLRKMKERMAGEVRETLGSFSWWEKGAASVDVNRWKRGRPEGFDVRYPMRWGKEKEGRDRRKRQREGLRLPRKLDPEDADRPELLVPIRLEFDVEHHKMRDTFVWNLNDPIVTPESFAQSIIDDYGLAPNYHSVIVKSIQEQLSDFRAHSLNYDQDTGELVVDLKNETPVLQGTLDDSQVKWWKSWRKRVKTDGEASMGGVGAASRRSKKKRKLDGAGVGVVKVEEEEKNAVTFDVSMDEEEFGRPMAIDEIKLDEELMHEEMRILIKLDIMVGAMKLEDQFEWDLENDVATPEEFSEVYAQDLGLGGEFKTAIAHSIREQIQMYQKSLFLVGHPSDGTPIQDEELRQAFLPSLAAGARPMDQVQAYTPLLNSVSDSDIERSEKEREKELNKRRKRNQRGRRGIVIPDREPVRTYRTPGVGFPELDPATLALAAAANASGSRRAAAAAASLTIANMVASENGTAFIPAPTPLPTVPVPQPKEKKPKGLFKAPAVPASVLRARAHVVAPIPSTAADVSKLPAPLENDPPPAIPLPPPPPEPKMKFVPKKSAKELEREAKEKEFVDGQHPNLINGVWHCSNCGCPENIAVGRRKGPLGDKSQCGPCGKFWHRHRRPRPVEYNADAEYHMRKDGDSRSTGKKNRGNALRAQSAAATATPLDISEPPTPAKNGDIDAVSRRSPSPLKDEDDRAISPVSTASSASEPPLAQKVKLNGAAHKSGTPRASAGVKETKGLMKPITPKADTPLMKEEKKPATPKAKIENGQDASPPASVHAPSSTSEAAPITNVVPQQVPTWLTGALVTMRSKYPDDKFEAILRRTTGNPPDWRIRCLDCPGKLYTPGPGESLSNYEVHLRNRQHRQRVNERLNVPSPQKTS
ncbi:SNF5-domain-containing protein [Macrolepiota fuliginosa MF-IS2]|uniref:SNF5-domain-containing protein n=1 Tax=Macrolepiota fuliginosa MF-IS2 TaxID=1400762 RepID=A0A9P5X486_9AGAR|nr:SNF5-domain-containing protein [Macrolepiota fuliginosa MF-IS2]